MPDELREICRKLSEDSPSEVARRMDISRRQLRRIMRAIGERLAAVDLKEISTKADNFDRNGICKGIEGERFHHHDLAKE